MKSLINKIVTTNGGWITRSLLKLTTVIGTATTTWLVAAGVDGSKAQVIAAGIATGLAWLAETGLSWVARKFVVK